MTKNEISKILDIPLSTLNDWEKSTSNRHTLYKFLLNSNIDDTIIDKPNHRLFHILNRNIDKKYRYSFEEIKSAFLKDNYILASQRDKQIYSSFFKECDTYDLETLISTFELSKRTIKKLYETLPIRTLNGISKTWDKRFRLPKLKQNKIKNYNIPFALQNILNKRVAS